MTTGDRVVQYVAEHIRAHGYSPSIREVMEGCGMSSTSVASYWIIKLCREGRLQRTPGTARTLTPVATEEAIA